MPVPDDAEVIDLTSPTPSGSSSVSITDNDVLAIYHGVKKGRPKKKRSHPRASSLDLEEIKSVLKSTDSRSRIVLPISISDREDSAATRNSRGKVGVTERDGQQEVEGGDADDPCSSEKRRYNRDGVHITNDHADGECSTRATRGRASREQNSRNRRRERMSVFGPKRSQQPLTDEGGSDVKLRGSDRGRRGGVSSTSLFYIDIQPAELPAKLPPGSTSAVNVETRNCKAATAPALLLPPHVQVSTGHDDGVPVHAQPLSPPISDEDDFIQYMDYDDTQKGVTRYFDELKDGISKQKTFVCKHCGAEGDHKTYDCPVQICLTCGARNEHSTRGCPISKTCFSCGMKGHINRDCPQRFSVRAHREEAHDCSRCGSDLHKANECPTFWRMYVYVSDTQREAMLKTRREKASSALGSGGEGYIGEEEWCYNCGEDGHLGDDCREIEHPSDFPKEPSAFSLYNTLSGPFADLDAPKSAQRRRAREWEYEGIFDDGHGFAGHSDVGKRGRDKETARMQKHARDLEEAEDDDDDWFGKTQRRSTSTLRPLLSVTDRHRANAESDRQQGKPRFEFSIRDQAGRYDSQSSLDYGGKYEDSYSGFSKDSRPPSARNIRSKGERRKGKSGGRSRDDYHTNGHHVGNLPGRRYYGGYGR